MSFPRSGSQLPSLDVGQDNCGHRLGQQPQTVPKITLDGPETVVNIGRAHCSHTLPTSPAHTVDKLTELHDIVAAHLSGSATESAVLGVLRDFTVEQKSRGEHAEQVVIALKRSWESLGEERVAWPREAQLHLLDRMVSRCIEVYYNS
jgi:hypothetical protein